MFKFTGKSGTIAKNRDGSYNVTTYVQTYSNLKWFDEPSDYSVKKEFVYELPRMFDP